MRLPIKLVLWQLFPILVFLAVDAFLDDPSFAIGSALAFVAVQAVITYRRTKKLDGFILLDAALIGGLGAVSLLSQDELFFKLKPAIIEGVMVPYLIFLALAPDRWIRSYFERYTAGLQIHPAAFALMRRLMGWMGVMVFLHAAIVLVAALSWSRQVWGWISGPGFFVLFLPLMGWMWLQRRKMRQSMNPEQRPSRRIRPAKPKLPIQEGVDSPEKKR